MSKKILTNKEALQAVLDGKIVKPVYSRFVYRYSDNKVEFASIDDRDYWLEVSWPNNIEEFEIQQEIITLHEYELDGKLMMLTDNFEYLVYDNYTGAYCTRSIKDGKPIKIPNGRTRKVYADTLEPVEE